MIAGIQSYFLTEHLPYDPASKSGDRLESGLKEYLLILIATEQAIISLENDHLSQFDPLVGENACQIRAIKILLAIYDQKIKAESLKKEILKSKAKTIELLSLIQSIKKTNTSLRQYIDEHKIDIQLNEEEIFFIKSFILTKTKEVKEFHPDKPLVENAKTNPKKIKDFLHVGTAFAWDFIKHLRQKLSASSVLFVQRTSLESNPLHTNTDLLSDTYSIFHNGLKCLPYYWMTRVLMGAAIDKNIPIVMIAEQKASDKNFAIIEKITLFFKSTSNGYKAVSSEAFDPDQAALFLIGSTCRKLEELPSREKWVEELLKHSPVDLVLAYAAAHRQYPDEAKDTLLNEINDEYYTFHKEKAHEWGCSLKNPNLFFLAHAFCDKSKNLHIHL